MDRISIKNLVVFAKHGVFQEEQTLGQKFLISADLYVNTRAAAQHDDLQQSVDYGRVAQDLTAWMQTTTHALIETAANQLARQLLHTYPLIQQVDLQLQKPWAPVGLPLDTVTLSISRRWRPAVIALGSNLGDRQLYLDIALEKLTTHPDIRMRKASDYIETAPVGYTDQNNFLNAVCLVDTLLSPHALLQTLHTIEAETGRTRTIHWGPRTLDLDLIYYDQELIHDATLTVPHPRVQERAFVLGPLADIAPYYLDPRYGVTVEILCDRLQQRSVQS